MMRRSGLLYCYSQAYEELKDMSHKVYLFNMYSLIQECYYQTTLPPPLSLVDRIVKGVRSLVKHCRRGPKSYEDIHEDCFSKYDIAMETSL